jgi:uncharacterized protein
MKSTFKPNPLVWLLASPHTGDNTQLLALADNLGWPYEIKKLAYKPGQTLARLVMGGTLVGLPGDSRKHIKPPYPDLILGAGRPTEAAALWVKRHANKTVKLVFLGTPWADLNNFDLVITTPQYGLPDRPNILRNDLPMHKVTPIKLAQEAKIWAPRFAHLPKPWTAIFVGGSSGPYRFTVDAARRLAKNANALPGSLLVTTSARTPLEVPTMLQSALVNPNYFHHWHADDAENPFFGFLALADRFIVTADSISMLSEAAATGKPVMLFDTESGPYAMRQNSAKIGWRGGNLGTTAFRLAMRLAPPSWSRDLRIVHNQLINSERASWSDSQLQPSNQLSPQTDLARATTRVRALFNL